MTTSHLFSGTLHLSPHQAGNLEGDECKRTVQKPYTSSEVPAKKEGSTSGRQWRGWPTGQLREVGWRVREVKGKVRDSSPSEHFMQQRVSPGDSNRSPKPLLSRDPRCPQGPLWHRRLGQNRNCKPDKDSECAPFLQRPLPQLLGKGKMGSRERKVGKCSLHPKLVVFGNKMKQEEARLSPWV